MLPRTHAARAAVGQEAEANGCWRSRRARTARNRCGCWSGPGTQFKIEGEDRHPLCVIDHGQDAHATSKKPCSIPILIPIPNKRRTRFLPFAFRLPPFTH